MLRALGTHYLLASAWFLCLEFATCAEAPSSNLSALENPLASATGLESTSGKLATASAATPPAGEKILETWEFEVTVNALQQESATKSRDKFNSNLHFSAIFENDQTVSKRYSGFGLMTAILVSRGNNSDQAPHLPEPTFDVLSYAWKDNATGTIRVLLQPRDAVTYSLLDGSVLGQTSILQHILPAATGPGMLGTLREFSIPLSTKVGAEFLCKFDTSKEQPCWYEGTAKLRVVSHQRSRYDLRGKFLEQLDSENPAETKPATPAAEPSAISIGKHGKIRSEAK